LDRTNGPLAGNVRGQQQTPTDDRQTEKDIIVHADNRSDRTSPAMRHWGRSGIETSALGIGCWAIGGEWQDSEGNALGWGRVDDDESIAAIRRAMDLGVSFFDTADVYGAGHSEEILGRAIASHRSELVIASKWGNTFDPVTRTLTGSDSSPEYVRRALTASLRRLRTDYLDLYQLHLSEASIADGARLRDACEALVCEGLIRAYAWSTDDPERAGVFAAGQHCAAVQHECSVLHDAPELLALCAEYDLASVNRSPLAMGLLSGNYRTGRVGSNDIRANPPAWLRYFVNGAASPAWIAKTEAIREVLTSDGRTPAQGALAWLWARSPRTVPIPGVRTVAQAEQNARAMSFGPLDPQHLVAIDSLLKEDAS
jgi:aryl-alcohol dehydrogenase-like predicted oxidoreductase